MVGDSHTYVRHILHGAIDIDVVVLVAVIFLDHLQQRCLATPRLGLNDDRQLSTNQRNHLTQLVDRHSRGEIHFAHLDTP
jgi:ribonuclease HII